MPNPDGCARPCWAAAPGSSAEHDRPGCVFPTAGPGPTSCSTPTEDSTCSPPRPADRGGTGPADLVRRIRPAREPPGPRIGTRSAAIQPINDAAVTRIEGLPQCCGVTHLSGKTHEPRLSGSAKSCVTDCAHCARCFILA